MQLMQMNNLSGKNNDIFVQSLFLIRIKIKWLPTGNNKYLNKQFC